VSKILEEKESKAARAFTTISGREIRPLYGPEDQAGLDYQRDLGDPGQFPYTRGIHQTMYRGRHWTMRQFAGFGSAAQTNARFKYLLEHGSHGLSVAFDLPTLMGRDPDHPLSLGEVGKCGVAITSLADMEVLLEGIPLDKVSTSMTINSPAAMLVASTSWSGRKQGVAPSQLSGTVQADILKEFIAQKEYIYPPRPSMRIIVDMIRYCTEHMPKWNSSPSPATTSARRARRRRRSWRSRCETASSTCSGAPTPAWTSTASRRGSASSSTRTRTSSRRSPSSARPGASGRAR
jgi:methylmalonyl-CoA mutase N-terminal domain/subunit